MRGLTIETMDDLPQLLSQVLGSGGRVLFYLGIFAAIYSSLVGHARTVWCLAFSPRGETLASDITQHVKRIAGGRLVVFVIADQAAADIRRKHFGRQEVLTRKRRFPRTGRTDEDDEGEFRNRK